MRRDDALEQRDHAELEITLYRAPSRSIDWLELRRLCDPSAPDEQSGVAYEPSCKMVQAPRPPADGRSISGFSVQPDLTRERPVSAAWAGPPRDEPVGPQSLLCRRRLISPHPLMLTATMSRRAQQKARLDRQSLTTRRRERNRHRSSVVRNHIVAKSSTVVCAGSFIGLSGTGITTSSADIANQPDGPTERYLPGSYS